MTIAKSARWVITSTVFVAMLVLIVFIQAKSSNTWLADRKFFAFKQLTNLGVTPRNQDEFDVTLLYQILEKQEPTREDIDMASREIDKIDSMVVISRVPDSNDHLLVSLSTIDQPPHLRTFEYYPSTFSEKELKELRQMFPGMDLKEVDTKGKLGGEGAF